MSNKLATVVDGEASESETEDVEVGKTPDLHISSSSEPFVIAGEAPESDEESSSTPTESASSSEPSSPSAKHHVMKTHHDSLLHQKLWECNVSLKATIDGLLRHTTGISVEKLSRADKTLLSVQESMRSTNANLMLARNRLKQISIGLENANCSSALPSVKIK